MTPATILIADDDRAIRTVLSQALGRLGHDVRTTGNAATLWRWVNDGDGDIVVTDVVMPDGNGLDLVPQIRKLRPEIPVIVMSAQNTLLTAVKANERGAFEYLPKPFDLSDLLDAVNRGLKQNANEESGDLPLQDGDERLSLIGRSPAMQEVYRVIARLTGTDLAAMISGESGTGKELVAQALHGYSRRRHGPFIAVNMAAIPRELIESELFGHERGAFTGATQRYAGRFEQAHGGSLFMDEIGDMPMEAQTRLLRVLQEGEYTRVGGRNPIKADVRIISATHRDLGRLVSQGLFREDLFYRMNVVPIRLPPLRERLQDIPDLVRHFLAKSVEQGLPQKTISAAALKRLQEHRWPGNIRELENLIQRIAALHSEEQIDIETVEAELVNAGPAMAAAIHGGVSSDSLGNAVEQHLERYFRAHGGALPSAGLYDRVLREVEKPLIELCLSATGGNQIKAAELLGLNRNTLRKKIRTLDIQVVRGGK